MKNQFKLLTLGTLSLIAASCGNKVTMPDPGTPVFTQFTYTGKDAVYEKNRWQKENFIILYYRDVTRTPASARKEPTITWYAPLLPSTPEYPFSILRI